MMSGRVIGFLAWLVSLLMVWGVVVFLSGSDLERMDELEQVYLRKKSLLERLEELPRREAEIRRQMADLGNEEASKFLYEGDHQAVQVLIQRDIRHIASQTQMTIGAMRALNATRSEDRLVPAIVQVNLSTNHEALVGFFAALEQAQPMLKVNKMSINVQRPSTASRAAQLRAVLEVSGYREKTPGGAR